MPRTLRPWVIALILATGGFALATAAPLYDWTKTPDKLVEPGYEPYVTPDFESRATLPETLAWIKRTLEQYGTVTGVPDTTRIVNVAAKDCTLQWEEKRYINAGKYLNDSKYSVRLADLDLRYGLTMAGHGDLRISTTGSNGSGPQFRIVQESFFVEGTRERSNGHAIVHAARLCGAKAGR